MKTKRLAGGNWRCDWLPQPPIIIFLLRVHKNPADLWPLPPCHRLILPLIGRATPVSRLYFFICLRWSSSMRANHSTSVRPNVSWMCFLDGVGHSEATEGHETSGREPGHPREKGPQWDMICCLSVFVHGGRPANSNNSKKLFAALQYRGSALSWFFTSQRGKNPAESRPRSYFFLLATLFFIPDSR